MRIGIIVEGDAEYGSLGAVLRRVNTPHTILSPLLARSHPMATPAQIARCVATRFPVLEDDGAELVLVIIDHETRDACPGEWAQQLTNALRALLPPRWNPQLEVVIKKPKFESWLVADVDAIRQLPGRFNLSAADENRIVPNRADSCDAEKILSRSAIRRYNKVTDAAQILRVAEPRRIGRNSRSFRRLLRVVGDVRYATQSRLP